MRPVPIAEFRDFILALYTPARSGSAAGKSLSTYRQMRQVLAALEALPGVTTTADLTTATAARLAAGLGPNPNTARGLLSKLKAAVTVAAEEGWVDRPPRWSRVMPREARQTKNPVKSPRQVRALLDHLEARATNFRRRRLYALTATYCLTGVRRDEALYLRVEDLDWRGPVLRVTPRPGRPRLKTPGSAREVPVCPELLDVYRGWVGWCRCPWLFPRLDRCGPWVGGSESDRPLGQIRAAAEAAGIGHVTIHGLRHSFASAADVEWHKPLVWIRDVLGHASIATTERYLHAINPSRLCDEARTIGFRRIG